MASESSICAYGAIVVWDFGELRNADLENNKANGKRASLVSCMQEEPSDLLKKSLVSDGVESVCDPM